MRGVVAFLYVIGGRENQSCVVYLLQVTILCTYVLMFSIVLNVLPLFDENTVSYVGINLNRS